MLDPATLSRLGDLELIARTVVEGFFRGLHRSRLRGSSVEFAEYRPYAAGDHVSNIDWRAYARTDRLYMKEYEDETNLRITILLDGSRSMDFGTAGLTKFRYASCLAASLGFLVVGQQDAIGLTTFDSDQRRIIPPRSSNAHLQAILAALGTAVPDGQTRLGTVLGRSAETIRGRGMVVLISDCLDEPRDILHGLARFRHRRSDVLVFHIIDPAELQFPYRGWTAFRDMESSTIRRLECRWVRESYLENLRAHLEQLRRGCRSSGVDYERLDTRTPFHLALAKYLSQRGARPR